MPISCIAKSIIKEHHAIYTVIAYLRMHFVNRDFTLKSCVARNRVTLRMALQFTPGPNNTRWTGRQPKQLKWKETTGGGEY